MFVVTDIHANLPAFEAALARIEGLGIERVYCGGDLVGYGPRPNDVCALLRELDELLPRELALQRPPLSPAALGLGKANLLVEDASALRDAYLAEDDRASIVSRSNQHGSRARSERSA